MRASQYLLPTLREIPADAEVISHKLLLRSAMLRQVSAGMFTWLPLGLRVLHKIENIVREEMNRTGAQEVLMPVVQPAELWVESGRWDQMGKSLLRMQDRDERDYCFSPTHEEVVTDLLRKTVRSYRQLPLNLYQINTKFRDEIRPRFGLMRTREFIMKDAYSFHLDEDSLDHTFEAMHKAYETILDRIGVQYRAVEADSGIMGGDRSREFQVLADSGEDAIAFSTGSSYAANVEKAEGICLDTLQAPTESLEKVATPGQETIADVASFLELPQTRCLKTLIVKGTKSPIALILRGDHDLNTIKAEKLAGVEAPIQFASAEEVATATSATAGSLGPVELKIPRYVDRSAALVRDFSCGANETGFHYRGVNWQRDTPLENVVDIRNVVNGDPSPDGVGTLKIVRGIEVGHIFKLGTKYSDALGLTVQDQHGAAVSPLMGCYGFGVSRLVAAIVEQCHSEKGILWPAAVAPADVHLIVINPKKADHVHAAAEEIYESCAAANIEVFLDDRDERPGVKFADAELIGIPHRITVGERSLSQGTLEYSHRNGEREDLTFENILARIRQ